MADKFRNKYRIASARAAWWDYSSNASYFVTICTKNREHYFGTIVNNEMHLTEIGKQACQCWYEIPQHFPFVILDEFVIMPNHIRGILIFEKPDASTELQSFVPPKSQSSNSKNKFGPQSQNLGSVIRGFKIGVTNFSNEHNIEFGWQPRFHDHIIRNNEEYQRIKNYIRNNPANWDKDKFRK